MSSAVRRGVPIGEVIECPDYRYPRWSYNAAQLEGFADEVHRNGYVAYAEKMKLEQEAREEQQRKDAAAQAAQVAQAAQDGEAKKTDGVILPPAKKTRVNAGEVAKRARQKMDEIKAQKHNQKALETQDTAGQATAAADQQSGSSASCEGSGSATNRDGRTYGQTAPPIFGDSSLKHNVFKFIPKTGSNVDDHNAVTESTTNQQLKVDSAIGSPKESLKDAVNVRAEELTIGRPAEDDFASLTKLGHESILKAPTVPRATKSNAVSEGMGYGAEDAEFLLREFGEA